MKVEVTFLLGVPQGIPQIVFSVRPPLTPIGPYFSGSGAFHIIRTTNLLSVGHRCRPPLVQR